MKPAKQLAFPKKTGSMKAYEDKKNQKTEAEAPAPLARATPAVLDLFVCRVFDLGPRL